MTGAAGHGTSSGPCVPLVMGIVNVTPDSFTDGGRFLDPDAAVAHGLATARRGRRHRRRRRRVDPPRRRRRCRADEELRRVVPVIEALAAHGPGRRSTPRKPDGGPGRGRCRRHADQRRLGLAVAGRGRARRRLGGHAHAGRRPRPCRSTRATTTSCRGRGVPRPSGRRRPRAAGVAEIWIDPGHRVRQDRRAQPAPAGATSTSSWRWAGRCWSAPAARRFLGRLAGRLRRASTEPGRARRSSRGLASPPRCGRCTRARP